MTKYTKRKQLLIRKNYQKKLKLMYIKLLFFTVLHKKALINYFLLVPSIILIIKNFQSKEVKLHHRSIPVAEVYLMFQDCAGFYIGRNRQLHFVIHLFRVHIDLKEIVISKVLVNFLF